MPAERRGIIAGEVRSDKSLLDEKLKLVGFGCNLCDWRTKDTEYFRGLAQFGIHNNQRHPTTYSARIVHIYKPR